MSGPLRKLGSKVGVFVLGGATTTLGICAYNVRKSGVDLSRTAIYNGTIGDQEVNVETVTSLRIKPKGDSANSVIEDSSWISDSLELCQSPLFIGFCGLTMVISIIAFYYLYKYHNLLDRLERIFSWGYLLAAYLVLQVIIVVTSCTLWQIYCKIILVL